VTPGSGFAYTLAYHNGAASPVRGELAWAAPATKTGSIPNLWLRR
jgi:hypothetical protein